MGKLFSIYYWVTVVLLWLKSQVGCEGKWLCPIEGIILSHHRPQEAWDVLAHMAEIKTESILGRRWNVKCCHSIEWIEVACHGCNLGDAEKAVMLFPPSFYLYIYLFFHSFILLQCVANQLCFSNHWSVYIFFCDSLCFPSRNITCVLNTPRLTNSCAIDRASCPSLVLSHKQGILPISGAVP